MGNRTGLVVTAVIALLMAAGCCKKKGPTRPEEATALAEEGWALFTQEDYTGALEKFNAALDKIADHPDANHGRGWTLAYKGDFHEARFSLVRARDLDEDNPDPWAGGAFVYSVLGDQAEVVLWAESALYWDVQNSGSGHEWQFTRRTSITHLHLRWVLAQAYLSRGSYVQCATQLYILDDSMGHSLDPESLLADLLALYSLFPSPF